MLEAEAETYFHFLLSTKKILLSSFKLHLICVGKKNLPEVLYKFIDQPEKHSDITTQSLVQVILTRLELPGHFT